MAINKAPDGLYHPKNEAEIIELVLAAKAEGKQIRCRGSAHSVSHAIYANSNANAPFPNKVNFETTPTSDNYNLMLDQYRSIEVIDEANCIVAVAAGTNLGIDPFDPTHTSTWENSMLQRLAERGWTVSNLGGIDFQSIGGFMSTGSSGGSIRHSIHDNLWGLRLIDGNGEPYTVMRTDENTDDFFAAGVSLGLLGIVSKVYLKCIPVYNIVGQESSTTVADAPMSMFGDNPNDTRPSIQEFLQQVEYTRLMWWPQRNIQQVVTWQAARMEPVPGFKPRPYQEFSNYPNIGQPVAAIFYILVGNYMDLKPVQSHLDYAYQQLEAGVKAAVAQSLLSALATPASKLATWIVRGAVKLASGLGRSWLTKNWPKAFAYFINTFQTLDAKKSGASQGTPQSFQDIGWKGLPMDNSASDDLMPTEFTEIWIPVGRSQQVLGLLRDYFNQPDNMLDAYKRTGFYAIELYGSKPNKFWMSMSYSDGQDEWRDGVIRLDIFWFEFNPGDPADDFFPSFWNLLRDKGIPNRLHWGKFRPDLSNGDPQGWVDYYRSQLPNWDQWLAVRAEKDPQGIFLNDYWRAHLGLTTGLASLVDEPGIAPQVDLHPDETPDAGRREA